MIKQYPEILAIIPARARSQRCKEKNTRLLAGKPLIVWSIEAALQSKSISRLIVSTDSETIASIAREAGAEVPFIRPGELAQADTPDLPVYEHAVQWLRDKEGYKSELIVWLRPTSPLRTAQDIDDCVDAMLNNNARYLRTVTAVTHHPYWMKTLNGNRLQPLIEGCHEGTYYQSQLLPPVYQINGVVDVIRYECIGQVKDLHFPDAIGHIIPPERGFDIDSEFDFARVEWEIANTAKEAL